MLKRSLRRPRCKHAKSSVILITEAYSVDKIRCGVEQARSDSALAHIKRKQRQSLIGSRSLNVPYKKVYPQQDVILVPFSLNVLLDLELQSWSKSELPSTLAFLKRCTSSTADRHVSADATRKEGDM